MAFCKSTMRRYSFLKRCKDASDVEYRNIKAMNLESVGRQSVAEQSYRATVEALKVEKSGRDSSGSDGERKGQRHRPWRSRSVAEAVAVVMMRVSATAEMPGSIFYSEIESSKQKNLINTIK